MQLLIKVNLMGSTVLLGTHEERYADICSRKIVLGDGHVLSDTYMKA